METKCEVCWRERSININSMKWKDIIKYLSMWYKYNKVLYDISWESYLYCSHIENFISKIEDKIDELAKEYILKMQTSI